MPDDTPPQLAKERAEILAELALTHLGRVAAALPATEGPSANNAVVASAVAERLAHTDPEEILTTLELASWDFGELPDYFPYPADVDRYPADSLGMEGTVGHLEVSDGDPDYQGVGFLVYPSVDDANREFTAFQVLFDVDADTDTIIDLTEFDYPTKLTTSDESALAAFQVGPVVVIGFVNAESTGVTEDVASDRAIQYAQAGAAQLRRLFPPDPESTASATQTPTDESAPSIDTATSQSASVPMFGGNPAHTGVMPGPAPRGELVELWRFPTAGAVVASPAVSDGRVYAVSDDGILWALDPGTGDQLWSFRISGIPAVGGGLVYVSAPDGDFVALDALTGAEMWSYSVGGSTGFSVPVVVDGVVYVGGGDNSLYAIDALTGFERWRYPTCCDIESSPSVAYGPAVAHGSVYLGPHGTNTLLALDLATGSERWRFAVPAEGFAGPVVGDSIVVVGTRDENFVFAVDTATGAERWRLPVTSWVFGIALADGVVYASIRDGHLVAIDVATGTQLWSFQANGEITAELAVVDRVVYVGTYETGTLHAIDAETGDERWSIAVGDGIPSGPVVVDGVVYLGIRMNDGTGALVALGGTADSVGSFIEGDEATIDVDTTLRGAPNEGSVEVRQIAAGTAVLLGPSNEVDSELWWRVTAQDDGVQGWLPSEVLRPES